jgi:hypothetical protein
MSAPAPTVGGRQRTPGLADGREVDTLGPAVASPDTTAGSRERDPLVQTSPAPVNAV